MRNTATMDEECKALGQYLLGCRPNDYIVAKYREAHRVNKTFQSVCPFDTFLMAVATRGVLATTLVDSYTSLFFRRAVLRRKLILLVAILESCSPTHLYFELRDSEREAIVGIMILWRGIVHSVTIVLAMILLVPVHLIFAVSASELWKSS
ncbi:MAG: hypothetical protein MN733_04590 [Nitrososphaera sp.]|nr:hypothetical protein [Nitrososphaera sp.]MCI0591214.1 hypothetical protein [Gammaproteobacteria bacterium]